MPKENDKKKQYTKQTVDAHLKHLREMRDSYNESARTVQAHIDQLKAAATELDGLLAESSEFIPSNKRTKVAAEKKKRKKPASAKHLLKVRLGVNRALYHSTTKYVQTSDISKQVVEIVTKDVPYQQIFRVLHTLREDKLVKNKRTGTKNIWWLTPIGKKAVKEWLDEYDQ